MESRCRRIPLSCWLRRGPGTARRAGGGGQGWYWSAGMRRDEEHWHVPGEGGLSALAAQAGLQEHWVDAYGVPRRVSSDTLRSLLDSMGLPGGTAARVRESRAAVESIGSRPELLVGYAGGAVRLPGLPLGPCLLEPEEGSAPQAGLRIACDESGAWLRPPPQPG